ncbi:MAG: hypothetical protein R3Y28_08585 [Candidatus Gastranaerophilales bacterium]
MKKDKNVEFLGFVTVLSRRYECNNVKRMKKSLISQAEYRFGT